LNKKREEKKKKIVSGCFIHTPVERAGLRGFNSGLLGGGEEGKGGRRGRKIMTLSGFSFSG